MNCWIFCWSRTSFISCVFFERQNILIIFFRLIIECIENSDYMLKIALWLQLFIILFVSFCVLFKIFYRTLWIFYFPVNNLTRQLTIRFHRSNIMTMRRLSFFREAVCYGKYTPKITKALFVVLYFEKNSQFYLQIK